MLLGFKTELKLNNQQRTELIKHCGVARHAWNWGLALTKQILDHRTKKEHLSLDQRVFQCEHCHFQIDRDLNAAINLSSYVSVS
ncbi:MAG: helix-turn-helix domain-containing protein [Rhizonema sp. PD38]|nr:helix-turn-helix domain-containing protein [Rhizonema sp. PD38]